MKTVIYVYENSHMYRKTVRIFHELRLQPKMTLSENASYNISLKSFFQLVNRIAYCPCVYIISYRYDVLIIVLIPSCAQGSAGV